MANKSFSWKPWHDVVKLREDLLNGDLGLHQFAADLYEVLMQRGKNPIYENVDSFFALTFPAANLRKLVGDVLQRLAGETEKAVHMLSLTYGGGKTHTLITLTHLVRDPAILPNVPSVEEFKAAAKVEKIPKARVAALCFDKIDTKLGLEVKSPQGEVRRLLYPWSILAWQIAGREGFEVVNGSGEERADSPSEDPLEKLLDPAMRDGLPLLLLMDEILMYVCSMVQDLAAWQNNLLKFFQVLTQAVTKAKQCCLVASMLSSSIKDNTDLGLTLEADLQKIFGREKQTSVVTISKDEVAEILRRRFFTPESISDPSVFRVHVQKTLQNIAIVDEYTKTHMTELEKVYASSYPFHPELSDVFYAKWNSLPTFQRTRGLLRIFALALRDAVNWDNSPMIGPSVFLPKLDKAGLPEATQDLVSIADSAVTTLSESKSAWGSIIDTELSIARKADSAFGLKFRETEQAVISVFLHSQPIGRDCPTNTLWPMIGMCGPQKIDIEKALQAWASTSFWLDDKFSSANDIPEKWVLGNKPNLNQMHASEKAKLDESTKKKLLIDHFRKEKFFTRDIDKDISVHTLPKSPADVPDDGKFHYILLGPDAACSSSKPTDLATKFLKERDHADKPRIHRNAVILLTPSKDGIDVAIERMADVLAWKKVNDELQKQEGTDQARLSTLTTYQNTANKKLAEAIRQAWCMAVTLNAAGEPEAFKLNISDANPPFQAIKADQRSRVKSASINPEALLPDGPYDIWKNKDMDSEGFPVKNLLGMFTKRTDMPKMLSLEPIRNTLRDGCKDGLFVLKLPRPNGTARTWWMFEPDDKTLADPEMEIWLPETTSLESIAPKLLLPGSSLGLWSSEESEISITKIFELFSGQKTIPITRNECTEEILVPKASREVICSAIADVVEQGKLWLLDGSTSLWQEKVPTDSLTDAATLRLPPEAINGFELTPTNLPEAWQDQTSTSIQNIAQAISAKKDIKLPWPVIKNAVNAAINTKCLEIDSTSGKLPSSYDESANVQIRIPEVDPTIKVKISTIDLPSDRLITLSDLSQKILQWEAEYDISFSFEIEVYINKKINKDDIDKLHIALEKFNNGVPIDEI